MNKSLGYFRFVVLFVLICAVGFASALADAEMLDWQGKRIAFENAAATGDNPWGFTAGLIDADDGSQHLFLTPNTAVTIYDLLGDDQLALQFRVHPWVAEYSDGAGVLVWFQDDEERIVEEDSVSVDNSDNWTEYLVDLSMLAEVTRVKLLCNNGVNDDDSGDWVVVRLDR